MAQELPFSIPQRISDSERKILDYICTQRSQFLFKSIGQLAGELGVSEATLSRFARHVGCDDFKSLKRLLIDQDMASGPGRKLSHTIASGNGQLVEDFLSRQASYIEKTAQLVDQGHFDKAVSILADARRIFIHAKNASASLASLLAFRLRRIALDVHLLPPSGGEFTDQLPLIAEGDVIVMFSFAKLTAEAETLMKRSKSCGAATILFTSRNWQEEGEEPDARLFVYRGEEDEFHSISAPAALMDALYVALSSKLGEKAIAALDEGRQLRKEYKERLKS